MRAAVRRKVYNDIDTGILDDPSHHLTGSFLPQTPLESLTPARTSSPVAKPLPILPTVSPWIRWVIDPWSAFLILIVPVVAHFIWQFLNSVVNKYSLNDVSDRIPNPFAPFFLLSNPVASSPPDDPRFAKGWGDLPFIAYHIVLFSLVRQVVTINMCRPIARYFGIKKEGKLNRFGEQGYAVVYFTFMGAWGYRIMSQLPTFWYRTEYFWIDYPHWDMKPHLKRYYLTHMSYWIQQLLVLVLGLEKPRKDYLELVAHHLVTIWLVGWSYLINLTLIGNAVYMSMDIPDAVFAFSKILNYIQWTRAKFVSFAIFVCVWTYMRHLLNFKILWSVWYEYDLIPEPSKRWAWADGTYLNWWMKYQIFVPLLLLQFLNLFWYYLIWRVAVRAIAAPTEVDDVRSEDEDDGDENTGFPGRKGLDEKGE